MFKKIRGKYGEKKSKKLNRDVISYEEVPLEDYEQETTRVSSVDAKKIVKIVIVLVILGLVVFAFANRKYLTPENISNWFKYDVLGQGEGEGYPVTIAGTNVNANNVICYGSTVSYASDTSFVTLSSNAAEIQNYQLSYASPVVANSGGDIIVYSLGGKEYHTGTVNKLTYTGKTEENIFTADISSSGVYGVVTQTSGYLSKLFVYNADRKQIYAYSFADYYITELAINPGGTGCVATGISASGGSLCGAVYVLDFTSEEPLQVHQISENTVYKAEYLSDSQVCLIGTNGAYILNISDSKLNEISYNQMSLTAYSVDTDAGAFVISLSRSGDGHSCTLMSFNSSGELKTEIETDLSVTSVDLYKGDIYALDGSTVRCYDYNKNEISSGDAGSGAKGIQTGDGGVYVLGVSEIRKAEMKSASE